MIDTDAEKVVRKLARSGHKAYLVGGCVRDLLLGRVPKDFDVATSATPSEIRELFRNCRIIGRRFRLAHVFFGTKIIETSTFRARPEAEGQDEGNLLIRRDNVFGNATEDARRRDFTINGLFYDVETKEVIDHVGGLADLEARLVRTIGDPEIRLQEDPVRILRAIKFAARLDLEIEPDTYRAILKHRHDIEKCATPRVLEEFYRLLRGGAACRSMELLNETGIDEVLAPRLATMFRGLSGSQPVADEPRDEEEAEWHEIWADEYTVPSGPLLELEFASPTEIAERRAIAWKVLEQFDRLFVQGRDVSNAVVLAAIIYPFVGPNIMDLSVRPLDASTMIGELAQPLLDSLRVARRDVERMRQLLMVQRRLGSMRQRRTTSLARREYFAEARLLHEIAANVVGRDEAGNIGWKSAVVDRQADSSREQGRRRRRRGGRRRRRADEGDDEGRPEGEGAGRPAGAGEGERQGGALDDAGVVLGG